MRNNNYAYFFDTEYKFTDQNEDNHYFHIGYFSSKKRAFEAIEKIKGKPLFNFYNYERNENEEKN